MKITRTKSAKELLEFLEKHTFKELPLELWDQYLWFYGKLLGPLSEAVSGYDIGSSRMYVVKEGAITNAIIFAEFKNGVYNLSIDARSCKEIAQIINFFSDEDLPVGSINVPNKSFANYLVNIFPAYELVNAVNKYYIKNIPTSKTTDTSRIRELTADEEWVFAHCGGWPGFSDFVHEGIRYFGYLVNDSCLSVAGITKLTRFRSEIIAVQTFSEQNRRKGYSRSVCNLAIAEALSESQICTWTANVSNLGSNGLAEDYGFTLFNSSYVLKNRQLCR